MVNVTDDGWFYGHTALDQHLACNVMRAVENRKPLIVAANTGLSAIIDSNGEIINRGGRRRSEVLVSEIPRHPTSALYAKVGDWPVAGMAILCVLAILLPPLKKQNSQSSIRRESSGDSAEARCDMIVVFWICASPRRCLTSASSDGGNPSRCMPVSTLIHACFSGLSRLVHHSSCSA